MNKKVQHSTNNLLNVTKAAQFLGVNPGTIRRWARAKELPGLKVGIRGDWRFTEDDLLTMVKPNHQKGEYEKRK